MEGMRTLLRAGTLKRCLCGLGPEDRMAAAWLVICGKALADRSRVAGYQDSIVRIEVLDGAWVEELKTMKEHFKLELTRIAGVGVSELHFIVKR